MTLRGTLGRIVQQEDINFLLTNRIPRRLATRFVGWFSQIENPFVRDLSIGLWRLFSDLDLSDAKTTDFRSMHDCFVRELKIGARPIDRDPGILVSPCDAIVGASGSIAGTEIFQIKGFPYGIGDLLANGADAEECRDGTFVTLRLTAGMYHRFHAPHDCRVESVRYISGDTWNVNPIALKRIERLFCKNERAVIRLRLNATDSIITVVPVAAILVASLRFRFLDVDPRTCGDGAISCNADMSKGDEMGWFQHGSTIILLTPPGFALCESLKAESRVRMGQPLMRLQEKQNS